MTKQTKKDMWGRQYQSLLQYDDEVRKDTNKNAKTKELMRKGIASKLHQAEEELRQLGALPRKPASSTKKKTVKVTKKTTTKKTTTKTKSKKKGKKK